MNNLVTLELSPGMPATLCGVGYPMDFMPTFDSGMRIQWLYILVYIVGMTGGASVIAITVFTVGVASVIVFSMLTETLSLYTFSWRVV